MNENYQPKATIANGIVVHHHKTDPHRWGYLAPDGRFFHGTSRASRQFAILCASVPGLQKPPHISATDYQNGSILLTNKNTRDSVRVVTKDDLLYALDRLKEV